jgi:hypothetical protein
MLSSAGLFYGDIAVPFRNSTGFQRGEASRRKEWRLKKIAISRSFGEDGTIESANPVISLLTDKEISREPPNYY